MNQDNAIGMFMGLFVGDALGGPLEFTEPNTGDKLTEMIGGGVHELGIAEWTDDGAMAMAIADAYISYKRFAPSVIMQSVHMVGHHHS
jgi:ADP-ribosylglycohydrolase